ncbi:MAG: DUF3021 domain-containing protein [Oscillospiraceae bacterium]
MKLLKEFVTYFVYITTGILLVSGTVIAFCSGEGYVLPKTILLDVALAGGVTALVTTLIYRREPATRTEFVILTIVHYIVLCGVMVFMGTMFGWIDWEILDIIIMCGYVAIVYLFTFFSRMFTAKRDADELNKALKSKYRD